MIIEYSIEDIEGVAATILQAVTTPIIRLDGAMGAGKTTVIRALCNQLGVSESISSPTFSLVNAYTGSSGLMYHFDFYRLENPDEALDFGVEEYFDSGKICFLEWAEKIDVHLPLSYDHFLISDLGETKRLIKKIKH